MTKFEDLSPECQVGLENFRQWVSKQNKSLFVSLYSSFWHSSVIYISGSEFRVALVTLDAVAISFALAAGAKVKDAMNVVDLVRSKNYWIE